MKFDSESARPIYAKKESDELVCIAFLDEDFVEEAKKLAKEELARRGLGKMSHDMIERVRTEVAQQRIANIEGRLQGFEIEEEMPSWRQAIRLRLAPYRSLLSLLAITLAGLIELDSTFNWGLLRIDGRRSDRIALLVMVICFVFVFPSRKEFMAKHYTKEGKRKS